MMRYQRFYGLSGGLFLMCASLLGITYPVWAGGDHPQRHIVRVPAEDRFTPFSLTIQKGDIVKWINNDSDDHTVVSDDPFTTAGHQGTNHLLEKNGGTFELQFKRPGTFVYYCRFHAQLDMDHQPIAPGPGEDPNNPVASGIEDGGDPMFTPIHNFGTPMMGVITVLEDH